MHGQDDLAGDLLDGVDAISKFTGWPPRRVYYLAERGLLPLFKVGDRKWQARRSTLRSYIERLEAGHDDRCRIATTASA